MLVTTTMTEGAGRVFTAIDMKGAVIKDANGVRKWMKDNQYVGELHYIRYCGFEKLTEQKVLKFG